MNTCLPPRKRGRKKRPPPLTEADRRDYHRRRLSNYRRSLMRAPAALKHMFQALIDQLDPGT